jgi:NAD(P)-dependent dehydrogenase (short-subunit alcohol dehydrogenase family)
MIDQKVNKEMAAKYKINVNAIAPGAIETPMNNGILEDLELKKKVTSRIPWNRLGKPEEVADLALFLVSDKAKYITGEIIRIDGGRSL